MYQHNLENWGKISLNCGSSEKNMASRTSLMLVAVTFIHLVSEKLKEFSKAK